MKSYQELKNNGRNKMEHKLHKVIADCINRTNLPNCRIIRDPACGGHQNIPLFYSNIQSRKTRYSIVDILILKNNKIKVIIEIEESDVTPVRICGKFLTSALSSHFIHESEKNIPIEMDKSATFIQILDSSRLKKGSSKIDQWNYLKESINSILPMKDSRILKYKLLYGKTKDFSDNKCKKLTKWIREALK